MLEWITVAALVVGPVLAVWIGQKLQDRKVEVDRKYWILSQLWGGRHATATYEYVRALNSIDVVFRKEVKVRKLWGEYYQMVNTEGMNNETGHVQWATKQKELLTEMARVCGFSEDLTAIDAERIYAPIGLVIPEQRATQIQEELLRFFKTQPPSAEVMQELLRVLKATEALSSTSRVKPPK